MSLKSMFSGCNGHPLKEKGKECAMGDREQEEERKQKGGTEGRKEGEEREGKRKEAPTTKKVPTAEQEE